MLEIILAWVNNLSVVCEIAAGIAFIASLVIWLNWLVDCAATCSPKPKPKLKGCYILTASLALMATIPAPDQWWHIRIALIKFQLASPENVKAGVERINRIADELECKYADNCRTKDVK